MPAARASGDASAASRSARSAASDPRAAATSAASEARQAGRAATGRSPLAIVAARPVVRGAAGDRHGVGRRGAGGRRGAAGGHRGGRRADGRRAVGRRAGRSSRRGGRSSPGSVVAARRGGRQRRGGGGLTLGRRSAQRRARRGDDPGGLGAHAEDAPAARRQDLEVEVVELRAEGLSGQLERLLDGLAGELLVLAHVSVVSLVGPDGPARGGGSSCRPWSSCRRRSGWPHASLGLVVVASTPGSGACAPSRTRAFGRTAGTCRPNPTIRYCWMIEKIVAVIQ